MTKEINETTRIPIGLAVVVFGGGGIWLATLTYSVSSTAKSIEKVEVIQDQYAKDLNEIKTAIQLILQRLPAKK